MNRLSLLEARPCDCQFLIRDSWADRPSHLGLFLSNELHCALALDGGGTSNIASSPVSLIASSDTAFPVDSHCR
jgi:hypothetical protein